MHPPPDVVQVLAEEEAERHHYRHRDRGAEAIGGEELPETHTRGAGEEEDGGPQTRRVTSHHHRPEAVSREVDPEPLLPFHGEHLADELVVVCLRPHPRAPVVDEQIAEDHSEVACAERRPVQRDAAGGERSADEQHQVLADGNAQARRREQEDHGQIGEAVQELGEELLHPVSFLDRMAEKRSAPRCVMTPDRPHLEERLPCWTQSPRGSAPPSTSSPARRS